MLATGHRYRILITLYWTLNADYTPTEPRMLNTSHGMIVTY
jgi:hypothetical protein